MAGSVESGGWAEEYFGGKTTLPRLDPKIVDQMLKDGVLVNIDHGRYSRDLRYRAQVDGLPQVTKQLIELSDAFSRARTGSARGAIRDQMLNLKRQYGNNHLLKQALTRYCVMAMPEGYDPTEPGTLDEDLPMTHRNNYIYHLHSEVCGKLGCADRPELVRWYNSIGTPLDICYGTDGFFVVEGEVFPDGKRRILPVDLTKNLEKYKDFGAKDDDKEPVFRFDSLLLYVDDEVEDIMSTREDFADRIRSALTKYRPDTFLDGFKYS